MVSNHNAAMSHSNKQSRLHFQEKKNMKKGKCVIESVGWCGKYALPQFAS